MVSIADTRLGAPGEIRTPDLLIRSQTLYPSELRALKRCEVIISLDTLIGLVNFVKNRISPQRAQRSQRQKNQVLRKAS